MILSVGMLVHKNSMGHHTPIDKAICTYTGVRWPLIFMFSNLILGLIYELIYNLKIRIRVKTRIRSKPVKTRIPVKKTIFFNLEIQKWERFIDKSNHKN